MTYFLIKGHFVTMLFLNTYALLCFKVTPACIRNGSFLSDFPGCQRKTASTSHLIREIKISILPGGFFTRNVNIFKLSLYVSENLNS